MLGVTVVGVLASPVILVGAATARHRQAAIPPAHRPRRPVPAPVRHQRQHRDPARTHLLDHRRLRHTTRSTDIHRPPPTTAALVPRRARATRRTPPRHPARHRPSLDGRAHPGPGHRALPTRQHRRRLTTDAALPAPRLRHPRRDHGRTSRRPRLRPHLQQDGLDLHPTRQRSRGVGNGPRHRPEHRHDDRHRHLPRRPPLSPRSPRTRQRSGSRSTNPERAARLAPLQHVLPPRPGGVLALIDTIGADVVVIAHNGLDQYASFSDLTKAVPLRNSIRVTAWRVPRDQIPSGDAERVAWLDEQWLRVDQSVRREVTAVALDGQIS